jgi:RHS repeat-associated protein
MNWRTAAPPARRRRLVIAGALLFILGPAAALAQTTTQVIEYYSTDALGSVRAVTKQVNGVWQVVARYDFMPFGEEIAPQVPPPYNRLFTGKERDQETGQDYFGARYYRASTGRFTTIDPELNVNAALLDPQRWNRYGYANNNPLKYLDPDGRQTQPVTVAQWLARYEPNLMTALRAAMAAHDVTAFVRAVRESFDPSSTVSGKIDSLLSSSNLGTRVEGIVGAWLENRYGRDVVDVNREVRDSKGGRIGEIDIVMKQALIEVKSGETFNANQLEKLVHDPAMNPNGLKVIVYMPGATKNQIDQIRKAGASYAGDVFAIDAAISKKQ